MDHGIKGADQLRRANSLWRYTPGPSRFISGKSLVQHAWLGRWTHMGPMLNSWGLQAVSHSGGMADAPLEASDTASNGDQLLETLHMGMDVIDGMKPNSPLAGQSGGEFRGCFLKFSASAIYHGA